MLVKCVVFILIFLVIIVCFDLNEGVVLGMFECECVIYFVMINEILIELFVLVGQLVEKGQVIVKFDVGFQ